MQIGDFTFRIQIGSLARNYYLDNLTYEVFVFQNNYSQTEPCLTLPENYSLTKREKDVVSLISLGYSNIEIAVTLKISTSTVKSHIQYLYNKSGDNNRIQLINMLDEGSSSPS